MELLAIVHCTVYADVGVVLWNSTFLDFIQHVLFVPCLLQCVYVYGCISVSLSIISPSLWKSLWVYFSLCCFILIFHLTHPSFLGLWISLTCSLSPGFFFQLSLLFQLGESWDSYLYTVLYLTSSVTPANSQTSCISNSSLVKEDKNPPFYHLLWASMRRISGMATATPMAIIVETSYLSGNLYPSLLLSPKYSIWSSELLHSTILLRGDWDPTWSYGLPNITEQNL